MAQSGDVRGLCRQHPDHGAVGAGSRRSGRGPGRFHSRCGSVAVVHRAVRQLRRSAGRGPQQGSGGVSARRQEDRRGQEAAGAALRRSNRFVARHRVAARRCDVGGGRRHDSGRRRGDRGRRLGERERHHRRVRPGDPGVRRRLQRRHRRHYRAVRLARGPRDGQSW